MIAMREPPAHHPFAHLQQLCALDRGEIPRKLAMFIAAQLGQRQQILIAQIQQLADAVRVRGDARPELTLQGTPHLALTLHQRAALLSKLLLGGFELCGLIGGESQHVANARFAPLAEFFVPRIRPVSGTVRPVLGREG
jgi:hypothetical protein